MVEPIGYLNMLFAIKGATLVLTDSDGLQEEVPHVMRFIYHRYIG